MTFDEWMRKRWYIILACVVAGGILANLFVPTRFPTAVGLIVGYVVSYLIYRYQKSTLD
jgi:uncharacterized membrane-anchored protein YhcB (DUF1043 family)